MLYRVPEQNEYSVSDQYQVENQVLFNVLCTLCQLVLAHFTFVCVCTHRVQ